MSILHIFKNTNEKFYIPFISLINQNFNPNCHHFMIEKYTADSPTQLTQKNAEIIETYQYWKLILELYKTDKIILHSLMSPRLMIILFLQPWLLKKCYWVIWGSDLYYYKQRRINLKSIINEWIRARVITNLKGLITQIKGDYELAVKWYNVKGKYYYSFMYPNNLYLEDTSVLNKCKSEKLSILVGNSADPSNNHEEVFNSLALYKDLNIEIICPLSYGQREYAKNMADYGNSIFGEKFVPLIEFIPLKKYQEMLRGIDVAIFNHNRQQGMGNITTLLGLGKKVYLREEVTTWQFCIDHDLLVYSANNGFEDLFLEMSQNEKQINIHNIKIQFSKEKLIMDLGVIFNE